MEISGVNRRELVFKSLAGLAGGFLGWLPVELVSFNHSLFEAQTAATIVENFIAMAILGGLIGGTIVAAEAQTLELTPALKQRFVRGFVVCLVMSLPANYFANILFRDILNASGVTDPRQIPIFLLVCARVVGWAVLGLMLGAGVGIATSSPPNILKGAAGGWVGGFIGGLAFDIISVGFGGLPSRMIGFSLIGLAIGLFIGLVQELTKNAWLKVESGRLRGREYRLERPVCFAGRAEECEVGLFGDASVLPQHARIEHHGPDFIIKDLSHQEGTFVNGARTETTTLKEGDVIRIGNYELRFHLRKALGGVRGILPQPALSSVGAVNGPYLTDADGRRIAVRPGGVTRLGRALDNDIVLQDNSVSRHHASITQLNGTFRVSDLGSHNGTYVRGERVTETGLADGDSVKFGEANFVFHA